MNESSISLNTFTFNKSKAWKIIALTGFIAGMILILLYGYSKFLNLPVTSYKTSFDKNAPMKYLIVTADDFGVSDCIDEGTLYGVRHGIINTITAMLNFKGAQEKIINAAAEFPELGIGVHLNITTGKPILDQEEVSTLVDKEGNFYPIEKIIGQLDKISAMELALELEAQIEAFIATGVKMDHLTIQHNVLAMRPHLFDVFIDMAIKYQIPVRNPVPISIENKRLFGNSGTKKKARKVGIKSFFSKPFKTIKSLKYISKRKMNLHLEKLSSAGVTYPDHMIDYIYGNPSPETMNYIISNLPEGISELIFHLGFPCDERHIPKGTDLEYLPLREQELMMATSSFLEKSFELNNIELINFADIQKLRTNGK